jgi:hypothetical protein
MKNVNKTTKTILFASLMAAMILPFSGMMMAEAQEVNNTNQTNPVKYGGPVTDDFTGSDYRSSDKLNSLELPGFQNISILKQMIKDKDNQFTENYYCYNYPHQILVVRDWPQYACVSPQTAVILAWPPANWDHGIAFQTWFISDVPATTLISSQNQALIRQIDYDNENYSIKFNATTLQPGLIYLNIEREMLDAKPGNCSDDNYFKDDIQFIATINGEKTHVYDIRSHERTRTIQIATLEYENEIEIFGVCENYTPKKAIQV